MPNTEIKPFRIDVPQSALDDLAERLARVRWANELPADQVTDGIQRGPAQPGWEYGVPLEFVQRLVTYWRKDYDWRAAEAKVNAYPQFTTEIDGQNNRRTTSKITRFGRHHATGQKPREKGCGSVRRWACIARTCISWPTPARWGAKWPASHGRRPFRR